MKTEKLEELRKLLSNEGWELLNIDAEDNNKYIVIAKEKDIWQDVEFVECIDDSLLTGSIRVGKIYPVRKIKNDCIGSTRFNGLIGKEHFKPSTHNQYVNQLVAHVKDNFFGIDVDLIDTSMIYGGDLEDNLTHFKYRKDTDTLYYYGKPIYQNGIWAKKKPEKFKVVLEEYYQNKPIGSIPTHSMLLSTNKQITFHQAKEIRQLIESYLNSKP